MEPMCRGAAREIEQPSGCSGRKTGARTKPAETQHRAAEQHVGDPRPQVRIFPGAGARSKAFERRTETEARCGPEHRALRTDRIGVHSRNIAGAELVAGLRARRGGIWEALWRDAGAQCLKRHVRNVSAAVDVAARPALFRVRAGWRRAQSGVCDQPGVYYADGSRRGGIQQVGRAGAADGGESSEHLPARWRAHHRKNVSALWNPFGDQCGLERGEGILAEHIQDATKERREVESIAGLRSCTREKVRARSSGVCGSGFGFLGLRNYRRGVNRQARGDQRTLSLLVRVQLKSSTELPRAFAHSADSHAWRAVDAGNDLRTFLGGDALPVVLNFHANIPVALRDTNPGDRTVRVPMNIGKAFLHDAKNLGLQVPRQTAKVFRNIEVDCDLATLGEAFDVPSQRGTKSGFIQQWRMQQIRNGANVGAHVVDERGAVRDEAGGLAQALELRTHGRKIHGKRGEGLADAVVQFTSDATTLFIL